MRSRRNSQIAVAQQKAANDLGNMVKGRFDIVWYVDESAVVVGWFEIASELPISASNTLI